uniref:Uncharacterized protein n=1 Tax=Ixodes ricinus TaxID=34613 RepID=A0A147BFS6_IXORI
MAKPTRQAPPLPQGLRARRHLQGGTVLGYLRPTADPAGACLLRSPAGRASSQRQGSGSRPAVLLQPRDHTVAEVVLDVLCQIFCIRAAIFPPGN